MILLVTDFGLAAPYQGQMKAVLHAEAPGVPVIDLLADAPAFQPRPAAYLLAALAESLPRESVFLCVVDPGVGGKRAPVAFRAGRRWFVGPDNGLMAIAGRRPGDTQAWEITWRPAQLSASFHGRDLFAPIAATLARGQAPPGRSLDPDALVGTDWPDDCAAVIYIDGYGNVMTGLRAAMLPDGVELIAGDHRVARAGTFSDVPAGAPFWYANSSGLAEIAVNQGHAAEALGLRIGDQVGAAGPAENDDDG